MKSFRETLGTKILFFDGGMGTMLQQNGLTGGELPEQYNLSHPHIIRQIHEQYLLAGADVITSNTFGANRLKYDNPVPAITAGLQIAREAADAHGAYVALDMGPTGKLLKPMGDLSFEDAYELYKEQVLAGKEYADLVLIETMGDLYEIKAAVLAAKENCGLPVAVTMIFSTDGHLLTGADIQTAAVTVESMGVDVIGLNCGFGPEQMLPLTELLAQYTSLPILVNPNAGLPQVVDGKTVYNVDAQTFAEKAEEIIRAGAVCIGGCCGTTPDYIREEKKRCSSLPLPTKRYAPISAVTSYGRTAVFSERTLLIGERINPTGKKRMKEALRKNDMQYLLNEGISQQDCGADILDVNVGLPEIDETKTLTAAVQELQAVTDLPLQLDTSDPAALESALRIYNGKPLINSVNGKQESMDSVFPLAAKYGGMVVCLLLDENGIPADSSGRIAIAEKILDNACRYHIKKEDLIFDALAMTVSTDPAAAQTTLETVDILTHRLGVKTVLGVSNVSFGLPRRENITSEFFVLAMQQGLSAGIINPLSERLMSSYHAFNALSGRDAGFTRYIEASASVQQPAPGTEQTVSEKSLYQCILKGLKQDAAELAKEECLKKTSLEIIDTCIIPALNEAGKGFEEKTIFLPQLLMCAEAAKQVFEVLKSHMPKDSSQSKGQIVIATVKNDIHDIGKNIVRTLLENYGFDVVDLGKDVSPETVANAVKQNHIRLAGLSALMTTTVPSMEETIRLIKKTSPECKIMVGGAVLTQNYADMIGADHYSRDAMDSVRYAQEIFDNK